MEIEEYKDEKNEHRIRLTAANGNIIYASTEGYKNAGDARQAAIKASIEILDQYFSDIKGTEINKLETVLSNIELRDDY